jgi:hypothetical protein
MEICGDSETAWMAADVVETDEDDGGLLVTFIAANRSL